MKVIKSGERMELKPVTVDTMKRVGAKAIALRRADIERSIGSNGQPMPPYSPRSPYYAAVTGRNGRTKAKLGGRQVLTQADLRAIRKGGKAVELTKSKKLAKFKNYAGYKKAMGKSGERDLELSGSMLNAMGIVKVDDKSVTYGFTREAERKKAEGNEKRASFFPLSPQNQTEVSTEFEQGHGNPLQFKKV